MNTASHHPSSRAGFSLPEVIVASAVTAVVMGMALYGYNASLLEGREGTMHVNVIDDARTTEQRLVKLIQQGRAVGVDAGGDLLISMPDGREAALSMKDADNNPETVEDNNLEYDPDTSVGADEMVACRQVTAIPGTPMFQVLPTSPRTALVSLHLGRVPKAGDALLKGEGYKGVELRFAATPRNRGKIYK